MSAPRKTPAEIEAHYLPLIAQARAEAGARRDAAWIAFPRTLAGIPVRTMTLEDYLALFLAGNAHLCAVEPPADEAEALAWWAAHDGVFLWRLSPEYAPDPAARDRWIARYQVASLDLARLHPEILDYLRELFADRPRPVIVHDAARVPPSIAASFAACWIHDFAAAYGWSDTHTLAMPLPRIFQLRNLQRLEAALRAKQSPPPAADEADELAAACFAEIVALQETSAA